MDTYRVAQICLNGHVVTTTADVQPERQEAFCSKCGEATITQCPNCSASIRGKFEYERVVVVGFDAFYKPPAFCHNCGKAFPWTERKIASAVELVEVGADLSPEEMQQFRSDLTELTKDSPKTQVASLRFNKVMGKAGKSIASGVRNIIVDVLSEAAKKAIWG
ncbi:MULTISPECIES: DUF2321 domain-containing protein [Snodgrassella]|uniref:DUF2321 domain-containing protein n=1 Tax=Snodgrassella TaxID=1193515 RepID=UPI000998DCB7|nr:MULTISPECIES: DUF2321 domain-containing protein [Snodgrassella]MBI0097089.1 DUF2321 domain-containing protein [Snodgrassella sp. W8134]MBI0101178.1 DUF2321 domain-containing protein [Snodgrassella sp. W8135]NUE80780.1 DUF2321 domain-containing protein [Snodgrassella sp. ESL0304]OOX79242.1 hypothetical protein BGH94_05035 [Snodgrassella alvi]ORF01215.1 hypothetical protein BGH95_07540 [Snodgrassella alvi]